MASYIVYEIKFLVSRYMPDAVIIDDDSDSDDDEFVKWEETELCKEIRSKETPGKILRAYRNREGLSIMDLATKTGIKYTSISAMEQDRRAINLSSAKRFGKALNCDYSRFLIT